MPTAAEMLRDPDVAPAAPVPEGPTAAGSAAEVHDLEAALAAAEAGRTPVALPAAAPAARAAPPGPDPAERPAPRATRRRTKPPSVQSGRFALVPALEGALLRRQLVWTGWSALVVAAASALEVAAAWPLAVVPAALGLGAAATAPRRPVRGLLVAGATVGAAALTALLLPGSTLLAAPQVLAAGAVAGLGATWLDGAPADRWRRLHGALGGAAAAGVGWWAAATLVGPLGTDAATGALQGALLGLVACQGLVAGALSWKPTDRIPSVGRIRATLPAGYREPALRARTLDRDSARHAPDPDTRDGLGEVAAWIFRLQWSRMVLDEEIAALDQTGLVERRLALLEKAQETDDAFTRERLEATARHLAALADHRRTLARERERTAALSEYASAFLEEARAGLAVARVQPGERTPARLDDVLGRLRSHATEREARRATAREVGALA